MTVFKRVEHREIRSDEREIPSVMGAGVVVLRFDDRCNNGHNTFSITVDGGEEFGGCMHDEIVEVWPEYKHLIPWHLVSTDGPLHYVPNTLYFASQGNLESARRCAVAPQARLEELQDVDWLVDRLPALMREFEEAMQGVFG